MVIDVYSQMFIDCKQQATYLNRRSVKINTAVHIIKLKCRLQNLNPASG